MTTYKEALGRATWRFLDLFAAGYPEKPNPQDQKLMGIFLSVLANLYPCHKCRIGFKAFVEHNPPSVSSNHDLTRWIAALKESVKQDMELEDILDYPQIGDLRAFGVRDFAKIMDQADINAAAMDIDHDTNLLEINVEKGLKDMRNTVNNTPRKLKKMPRRQPSKTPENKRKTDVTPTKRKKYHVVQMPLFYLPHPSIKDLKTDRTIPLEFHGPISRLSFGNINK